MPHPKRAIRFVGAQAHNLKGIDVTIPLNMMVAVLASPVRQVHADA